MEKICSCAATHFASTFLFCIATQHIFSDIDEEKIISPNDDNFVSKLESEIVCVVLPFLLYFSYYTLLFLLYFTINWILITSRRWRPNFEETFALFSRNIGVQRLQVTVSFLSLLVTFFVPWF